MSKNPTVRSYYLFEVQKDGAVFYLQRGSSGWVLTGTGDSSFGMLSDPRIIRMQSELTKELLSLAKRHFKKHYEPQGYNFRTILVEESILETEV